MKSKELIIGLEDIKILSGRSYLQACLILKAIEKRINDHPDKGIPVEEISALIGIDIDLVLKFAFGEG